MPDVPNCVMSAHPVVEVGQVAPNWHGSVASVLQVHHLKTVASSAVHGLAGENSRCFMYSKLVPDDPQRHSV